MGALLLTVEKVTYLTNRCAIYEMLYRHTPGAFSDAVLQNLDTALIEVYAFVLRLIALSHKLFTTGTVARTTHAIFKSDKIIDLLSKCQDLEPRLEIEAQNCERARSTAADDRVQRLLENLKNPVLRTDAKVSALLGFVETEKRLALLEWISNMPSGSHHRTVSDQRTRSTCMWLLEHPYYRQWRTSSSSMILWLQGTGMSSYMKYLIVGIVIATT